MCAGIVAMDGLEKSDESSSCTDQPSIFVRTRLSRWKTSAVFGVSLVVIWGVSSLPAVFYFSPRAELPPTVAPASPGNASANQSLPPLAVPCNKPLVFNKNSPYKCVPPCPFVTYTNQEERALKILDNLSIAISLLAFTIVLATWIRIKPLLKFPHIIPLYIQSLTSVIALLLAVGNGIGRKDAFCSSEFLKEARANPTMFCKIQGVLTHYATNALAMWFLVYSINLVQMIYSTTIMDSMSRKAHVISSSLCWLLPIIPVIIVLTSKEKYNVDPNMRLCFVGSSSLVYYTQVIITEISQAVGCTCLFIVAYKLFMLREVPGVTGIQADKRKNKMNKVVIRLICLLFAYAFCSALTYIPICVQIQYENVLGHYINKYFGCLMFHSTCPKSYQQHAYSKTIVASTLSTALFAIATVSFLAFNKQSRKLWNFWIYKLKSCCC